MELFLLRHAIAVEQGTAGYVRDGDRPLTSAGAKKMRRIAQGMKALALQFDVILSSPFARARETAEIVADVFNGASQPKFTKNLEVGGEMGALIQEIVSEHNSAGSVLLVGHEPLVSRLISTLLCGDDTVQITMKKGGLCKLNVEGLRDGRCASLEWLLTPRQLITLAG